MESTTTPEVISGATLPARPGGCWPKILRWHTIHDTVITPMSEQEIIEANLRRAARRPQAS